MKKIITCLSVLAVLFSGCSNQKANNNKDKLQVYTSFYIVYDFVSKIGGEKIQIYNLIPTGTEPHDWEPNVKDMMGIEEADVFFYNGAGMEGWIEKVSSSINNKDLKYVELAKEINVLSKNKDVSDLDPHIWLNPLNVKAEMKVICDNLSELDPENKNYYEENYNIQIEKLNKLDNDYRYELGKFENKNIIVSHSAYEYLCKAYGLNQIAIEGTGSDSEPSPKKMAEISDFISKNNIKYIFYEELTSPKTANIIADETNTQLLPLSSIEGLTEKQISENGDYFSVMYQNLENLKKALGE